MLRKVYASIEAATIGKLDDVTALQEIENFANSAHYSLNQDKLYVKVRALSAVVNLNYDGFTRDELKRAYSTFEGKPVYVEHDNMDMAKARGRIIAAEFEDDAEHGGTRKYACVNLLLEIDADRYPLLAKAIKEGKVNTVSMGCFAPGTQITLSNGMKKSIEDIVVGDSVITHTGKIEPVTYIMEKDYSGLSYQIKTFGQAETIVATPEHPIWVRRERLVGSRKKYWELENNNTCKCGRAFETNRQLSCHLREVKRWNKDESEHSKQEVKFEGWVEAKDLQYGDYVLTPILKKEIEDVNDNIDFARLLGYYLAEGCVGYDKSKNPLSVEWGFDVKETEYVLDIQKCLDNLGYKATGPYIKDNCATIRCNNPQLASLLLEYGGRYSWGKALKSNVFGWNKENQSALLKAYFNGDGCYKNDHVEAGTASKVLAEQLFIISLKCGLTMTPPICQHSPSAQVGGRRPKYVMQTSIKNNNDIMCKEKEENYFINKQNKQAYVDDNGLWRRVVEVSIRQYDGKVYNFDVDGDDSYIAGDISVHNCDVEYSICSICGKQARTEFEYCEHIRNKGATYLDPKTGEKKIAYEDNRGISFFEISWVKNPADESAQRLAKVASMLNIGDTVNIWKSDVELQGTYIVKTNENGCYQFANINNPDSIILDVTEDAVYKHLSDSTWTKTSNRILEPDEPFGTGNWIKVEGEDQVGVGNFIGDDKKSQLSSWAENRRRRGDDLKRQLTNTERARLARLRRIAEESETAVPKVDSDSESTCPKKDKEEKDARIRLAQAMRARKRMALRRQAEELLELEETDTLDDQQKDQDAAAEKDKQQAQTDQDAVDKQQQEQADEAQKDYDAMDNKATEDEKKQDTVARIRTMSRIVRKFAEELAVMESEAISDLADAKDVLDEAVGDVTDAAEDVQDAKAEVMDQVGDVLDAVEEITSPAVEARLFKAMTIAEKMVAKGMIDSREKLNKISELKTKPLSILKAQEEVIDQVKTQKVSRTMATRPIITRQAGTDDNDTTELSQIFS